jgi:hypothetical protein
MCRWRVNFNPSRTVGFKSQLLPTMEGLFIVLLNALMTTHCTEAGSTWRIEAHYSASRLALKVQGVDIDRRSMPTFCHASDNCSLLHMLLCPAKPCHQSSIILLVNECINPRTNVITYFLTIWNWKCINKEVTLPWNVWYLAPFHILFQIVCSYHLNILFCLT